MSSIELAKIQDLIIDTATDVGIKVLGAIALWVIGRWLIGFALRMVRGALERQQIDPTVVRYVGSVVNVTLNILLAVGILGYFGIQTTTFAALFATAGIAIGAAWAGLLSNFAAGVFLIVLRPFKVGDFVIAGGVNGTIKEIGLFSSTIITPDNIQNFSNTTYRRVDLKCQLPNTANHDAAIALLKQRISAIPNVLTAPPVEVSILEASPAGPILAVRPYCSNDHYWQVYFDTNAVLNNLLVSNAA
jgi:small conductance mechanosensitive channel